MNEKNLTIGKLAAAAEVGVETVRYYQRRGLLETPGVSVGGGVRRYGAAHLERLRFIKRAQGLGFSLADITDLLSLNDSRDHRAARALAGEKIGEIETRIERLEKMAAALRQLVDRCACGGEALPCPIIRMTLD